MVYYRKLWLSTVIILVLLISLRIWQQHSKTKHIEIRYRFIRDLVERLLLLSTFLLSVRMQTSLPNHLIGVSLSLFVKWLVWLYVPSHLWVSWSLCYSFYLLWPKLFFFFSLGLRLHNIHTLQSRFFCLFFLCLFFIFLFFFQVFLKKEEKIIYIYIYLYYTSSRCVIEVGLWNLHFMTVYLVLLWWALFFSTFLVCAM